MKIGHPKDFWGGVCFAAIGLLFLVIARGVPGLSFLPGYTMGTPARMGPAFFPFWLGTILFILGAVIAIRGMRTKGGAAGQLEKWHWKPLVTVLSSIVAFGLLLKIIGMLLSGVLLVIGASFGSHEFRLKPTLILAVFLVIFSALVFVVGLKLPIPLCPDIESLQTMPVCRS
jgi:putative tricarboxylic transport membrane protein